MCDEVPSYKNKENKTSTDIGIGRLIRAHKSGEGHLENPKNGLRQFPLNCCTEERPHDVRAHATLVFGV